MIFDDNLNLETDTFWSLLSKDKIKASILGIRRDIRSGKRRGLTGNVLSKIVLPIFSFLKLRRDWLCRNNYFFIFYIKEHNISFFYLKNISSSFYQDNMES